jgi:endonuclease III
MTRKHERIAQALLDMHGGSFAEEVGAKLDKNTPSPLFRWLCASLLMSARISSGIAVSAANALVKKGWTTARKMDDSTWRQRTDTLNRSGYARYDEKTSTMLGDMSELLLERYDGDLRNLRKEAECDPGQERKLLKQIKGIGDVGANIFFREAQIAWDELYPFADRKALEAAGKLGLADDPGKLAKLVGKRRFPALLAALVRTDLAGDYDKIREHAKG